VLAVLPSGVSKEFQSAGSAGIWSLNGVSKCWHRWHLELQRALKVLAAVASGVSKGFQGGFKVLAVVASGVSPGTQGSFKVVSKCCQRLHLESQVVSRCSQSAGSVCIWSLKGISKWWQRWHLKSQRGFKVVSKCWQRWHLESQRGLKFLAAVASGDSKGCQSIGSSCIWSLKGISRRSQSAGSCDRRGSGSFV
jgi:hypothetical protein